MSTIPTLPAKNIRTFAGEQHFQQGQQLAHDGVILNPGQQAMALKAYCYGSLPEPYRVQVTFDAFMRYTGQRIQLYTDLTVDECIETIRDDPYFSL